MEVIMNEDTKKVSCYNIRPMGNIDMLSSNDFLVKVKAAIFNNDVKILVLDFSCVEFVSSMGLRVLLEIQKLMQERGELTITNVSSGVKDIFKMTGFDNILTVE